MGWRSSVVVALAIPLSMLMSFAIVDLLGYTLNMIVLFSLVLALGMLVDNAIVIVENIYRHMQQGYSRVEAALRGTREVAWPVTTSTATALAAFAPMLFGPDVMGDFMSYLPMTVMIVLASSLFVALIINPTVCSLVSGGKGAKDTGPSIFVRAYRRVLATSLRSWYVTIWLALLLFAGTVMVYGRFSSGVELFPEIDPDNAFIEIRMPQGTNIRETDALARELERRIEPFRGDLQHVVTNVGSGAGDPFSGGGGQGPHMGVLRLVFNDYEDRVRPSAEAVAEMREAVAGLPGAEIKVQKQKEGPPTGAPVSVEIIGREFSTLRRISDEAKRRIADVSGLVNLRSDFEGARPELVFRVDRRRAMLLGVNTAVVGQFLKTSIFGTEVGTFRDFNDEYDITVRLPQADRSAIDRLFTLRVPNAFGQSVPLTSLGMFDYSGGFGTITRVDQKRVITLSADAEGRLSAEVLADVQARLRDLELPPGYRLNYAGEKEEQEKAQAFLLKAFFIAVLCILLILVAQFNSFAVPVIIVTTVILSLIGVLAGLMLFQMPFGIIMTGIGVISLAGVVVNNAIVLLAYTQQLEREGLEPMDAALQAGQTRLRPVLLTATTTILGLVPMATGMSFDVHTFEWATRSQSSEWWSSMAIVVIFGLAVATVLTLIVVPTTYYAVCRVARSFGLGRPSDEDDEEADEAAVRAADEADEKELLDDGASPTESAPPVPPPLPT
jgi:multidrug efflux pump subunit AcrB